MGSAEAGLHFESTKHHKERRLLKDSRLLESLTEDEKEHYLRFIDIDAFLRKQNAKRKANEVFKRAAPKIKAIARLTASKTETVNTSPPFITSVAESSRFKQICDKEAALKKEKKLRFQEEIDSFWTKELQQCKLRSREEDDSGRRFTSARKKAKRVRIQDAPHGYQVTNSSGSVLSDSPANNVPAGEKNIWKLSYRARQRALDLLFPEVEFPEFTVIFNEFGIARKVTADEQAMAKLQQRSVRRQLAKTRRAQLRDILLSQNAFAQRVIDRKGLFHGADEADLVADALPLEYADQIRSRAKLVQLGQAQEGRLQAAGAPRQEAEVLAKLKNLTISTLANDSRILHTPRSVAPKSQNVAREHSLEPPLRNENEQPPLSLLDLANPKTTKMSKPMLFHWRVDYPTDQ